MRGVSSVGLVVAVACTPLHPDDPSFDEPPAEVDPGPAAFEPAPELELDCLAADVEPRVPLSPPHPDLRLDLQLVGPAVLDPGERPRVRASVHNTSTLTAHPVVLPGDGSEMGWREPMVSFSAFVEEPDGC